ncbi:unnamed protein product [Somion occarium]|uniref:F-box domain-containing protein n=2 Tax=Somion occarium TaxID=3059160 RepID=A0ABP1CP96_9APHY
MGRWPAASLHTTMLTTSPIKSILHLPLRVLLLILDSDVLSYQDILACKQVCKLLRRIIDGTPSLQYKILLAATGMDDMKTYSLSAAKKLAKLRQYEAAWADLFSPRPYKSSIPILGEPGWEFFGGVFAQFLDEHTIQFIRPRFHIRGVKEDMWALSLSLSLSSFYMDPYQDLLMVVVCDEGLHCLHLLDIHTGSKHALAKMQRLLIPADEDADFEINSFGNKVVMLIRWEEEELPRSRLAIWDWQLGIPILIYDNSPDLDGKIGTDYVTFTFLDSDRIVFSVCDYTPRRGFQNGRLVVIDLALGSHAFSDALTFQLPELADDCRISELTLFRKCSLATPAAGTCRVPFRGSQEKAAIFIHYSISNVSTGEAEVITIVLPTCKLLFLCDEYGSASASQDVPRAVLWDLWGPKNTRALVNLDAEYQAVFGTRLLCVQDDYVTLYDFNHLGALSDLTLSLTRCMGEDDDCDPLKLATQFKSPSTIKSKMLAQELTTTLPYRVLSTGMMYDESHTLMFSEDTVIIMNDTNKENVVYSI